MPIQRKTLRAIWGVYPIQEGRESSPNIAGRAMSEAGEARDGGGGGRPSTAVEPGRPAARESYLSHAGDDVRSLKLKKKTVPDSDSQILVTSTPTKSATLPPSRQTGRPTPRVFNGLPNPGFDYENNPPSSHNAGPGGTGDKDETTRGARCCLFATGL